MFDGIIMIIICLAKMIASNMMYPLTVPKKILKKYVSSPNSQIFNGYSAPVQKEYDIIE